VGVSWSVSSRGIDVQFKRDLGVDSPDEWRDEIEQVAVPGGIFGEIVFFHTLSKTLILADTILNLELEKLKQPWRFATWLTGMYYPNGQLFFGMRLRLIETSNASSRLAFHSFDLQPSTTRTWAICNSTALASVSLAVLASSMHSSAER
jgi:hypothetical protein